LSPEGPWTVRRARAVHLLGQTPHAEEILTFYVELTEAQERVANGLADGMAKRESESRWSGLVRSAEGEFPRLRVERLPLDELVLPFRDFLSSVAGFGTETIKVGAPALLSRDDEGLLEPLQSALGAWGKAEEFYARAFLEPVITSIVQADPSQPADWTQSSCFECGGPPQVAVLRDLPDAVGHRSLICSMCATEWRFQRLTCPHCGETKADKLPLHTAESIAHVRVDACTTCTRYIKTVDLRKDGTAVPLVDELAAVELDIWAREQGLRKLRANVLGL
jgi:FdhE protein